MKQFFIPFVKQIFISFVMLELILLGINVGGNFTLFSGYE
jgi:hypothetical protein